jgi:hypothetical protein
MGALENLAGRFHILNRGLEIFSRDLGVSRFHFLVRKVLDPVSGQGLPKRDPATAKPAIAVKDQNWFGITRFFSHTPILHPKTALKTLKYQVLVND